MNGIGPSEQNRLTDHAYSVAVSAPLASMASHMTITIITLQQLQPPDEQFAR